MTDRDSKPKVPEMDAANALTATAKDSTILQQIRIRKLTPRECWRLMGFSDTDFFKARYIRINSQEEAEHLLELDGKKIKRTMSRKEWKDYQLLTQRKSSQRVSNTQLYRQAGNSIVVNVLMNIFEGMI